MPYQDVDSRREYQRAYYKRRRQEARSSREGAMAPSATGRVLPADATEQKRMFKVWLPASLHGRLNGVMIAAQREGKYIWRNESHLVQDLLERGLMSIEGSEAVDSALEYLQAVRSSRVLREQRVEMQGAFAVIQQEINEMTRIGETDGAAHYYKATRINFHKMTPTVWRDWLLNKMEKTFPRLHAMVPERVNLDDRDPMEKVVGVKEAKWIRLVASEVRPDVTDEARDRMVVAEGGSSTRTGARGRRPKLQPAPAGPTKRVVVIPDRLHQK